MSFFRIAIFLGALCVETACYSCAETRPHDIPVALEPERPPELLGEPLKLIVLRPSANADWSTSDDQVTLEGFGLGPLSAIIWSANGSNRGVAEGTRTWRVAGIPLALGGNRVELTAIFGTTQVSVAVTIRRNNILRLADAPTIEPSAGFIGEPTELTVKVPIDLSGTELDPATIRLVTPLHDAWARIYELADDGDASLSGDELPQDGVFGARFTITRGPDGYLPLYVAANRKGGGTPEVAYVGRVQFVPHLAQADYEKAISFANTLQALFEHDESQDRQQAQANALAALSAEPAVLEYGASESGSGVWAVMKGPLLVAALWNVPGTRGSSEVGNRFTFTGGAFNDQIATDEAFNIDWMLRQDRCPAFEADDLRLNGEVTLDRLRALTRYGVIALTTHGAAMFGTMVDSTAARFGFEDTHPKELLATREQATFADLGKYELMLRTGQLALTPSPASPRAGSLAATYKFFEMLPGTFPKSIVYAGACRSLDTGGLAAAFLRKGASAYYGYSGDVANWFAWSEATELFGCLLTPRNAAPATARDCFHGGRNDGGRLSAEEWVQPVKPAAYIKWLGWPDATLADAPGLRNSDFEEALPAGWLGDGDARVMRRLGGYGPPQGNRMGLISTGLGFTQQNGAIHQTFCIPKGARQLTYDWNFISAEFKSWCGDPRSQDTLEVRLTEVGEAPQALHSINVGDLCSEAVASQFKVPDYGYVDDDGESYATGWKGSSAFDISAWAGTGKPIRLEFALTDRGDSLYDTVVLLDRVQIQ